MKDTGINENAGLQPPVWVTENAIYELFKAGRAQDLILATRFGTGTCGI